jgi:subtilisin family serine protease
MMKATRRLAAFSLTCLAASLPCLADEADAPGGALAATLAGLSSKVQNRSRSYLSTGFIFDPELRRQTSGAETATSNLDPAFQGFPVQKDHLLVLFKPDATKPQIEALLKQYGLTPQSGTPEIGLLVVSIGNQTPAVMTAREGPAPNQAHADIVALRETAKALRSEPIVATAALNAPLGPTSVPQSTDGKGRDGSGTLVFWDWREGPGTPSDSNLDGNYGQKMARFPAAWNFNNAIRARSATPVQIRVGILDAGFHVHEDLVFDVSAVTPLGIADHGNHVAGIIAARKDNSIGVNGATPFARTTVCTARNVTQANQIPAIVAVISDVVASLTEFILNTPDLKVINISLGYNWVPNLQRNPNSDLELQDYVKTHGSIMGALASLAAQKGIIIVSAAGNDTVPGSFPDINAQWGSPFNYAAMNPGINGKKAENVIVVESIGRTGTRSSFSNVGGCLSAPGERILSAVAHDELGSTSSSGYAAFSGTSMATPQVTGLVALMYAYNPKLTHEQVLDILRVRTTNRPATANPAPPIDAFAALLECRPQALKDLADLTGDGRVDLADFNKFKAALHQVEGTPIGAAEDLNGDGVIGPAAPNIPGENVWPRADLNGSGRLSRDDADKRSVKGESLSDLEVMMKVWQDTTVSADALAKMLGAP